MHWMLDKAWRASECWDYRAGETTEDRLLAYTYKSIYSWRLVAKHNNSSLLEDVGDYATLAEAKAVAEALVAMGGK